VNPSDLQTLAGQIAVPLPHLSYLLEQLKLYLPTATVWAFGSRIKGSHRPASDLDLAVLCDKETAHKILPKLNDVFIESNLPFKVQLLDFNRLPTNMQDNIKKKFVVLYQPKEKRVERTSINTKKRRHHYIWRKYLRAWSTNELIWCCKEGNIFNTNLINIGQIRDFYKLKEISDKDIEFINKLLIEPANPNLRQLNKNWISSFNQVFKLKRDLEQRCISNEEINMLLDEAIYNTEEEIHGEIESSAIEYIESILKEDISFYQTNQGRMAFTHFLCVQYLRTNKMKSKIISQTRHIQSIDVEKIWNLLSYISATNIAYSIYSDKSFSMYLLKNQSQKELITGDQPVINTYAMAITNAGPPDKVEFYYPVSPKLAILLTEIPKNGCSNVIIFKEDEVNSYNLMMIKESHSQIYAASEETLNELLQSGKYKCKEKPLGE
jgi:predicted nucleotidyltransferase